MQLIDTHCHIHFKDFPVSTDEIFKGAAMDGVTKFISVGTSLADSQDAVDFAHDYNNAWATVGAHPHDGSDFLSDKNAADKLKKLLKAPKVVAIGEIGLDYYHPHTAPADQQKSLRSQIEIGLDSGLPFVFHVRDAWRDFWPIVDEYKIENAVVHSFSSGPKILKQVLERGLFVGLNGIMTFTRDQSQLEAARQVPLDRLLLETDAPFLTPEPFRGQTCQPKHVRATAEFLAHLRSENLQDLAAATTKNAEELFRLK